MEESGDIRIARIEEQLKAMETALQLQAAEYERRLEVLNHAHEQAREVAKTTVTSEKFEDYVRSDKEAQVLALEAVEKKLDDLAQAVRDNGERISIVEGENRIKASTVGWALAAMALLVTAAVALINVLVG